MITPVLVIWYLILWISLINYIPIMIGPGNTEELLFKMIQDEVLFERICYSTILYLHMLIPKIRIPSIYLLFNSLMDQRKASCAEYEKKQLKNSWYPFGKS